MSPTRKADRLLREWSRSPQLCRVSRSHSNCSESSPASFRCGAHSSSASNCKDAKLETCWFMFAFSSSVMIHSRVSVSRICSQMPRRVRSPLTHDLSLSAGR